MQIMKKTAAVVLALSVSVQCITVHAVDDVVNMALNRSAVASSNIDEEHGAAKGNDGLNLNEWYTWWAPSETDSTPWWQVDMLLGYQIDSVELETKKNENRDATRKSFRVLASNDPDFNEYIVLAELGEVPFKKDTAWSAKVSDRGSYRYVRVEKTKEGPFNIGEFRIWVRKDSIAQGIYLKSGDNGLPDYTGDGSYVLPADIVGTEFARPVMLLSALNIMRGYANGNFKPESTITRAEFVSAAVRLLNFEGLGTSKESAYEDVLSDHWAFDSIVEATKLGIVNGMGDGTFGPEEKISEQQALKILVSILGYDQVATGKGGYPMGYLTQAATLGLSAKLKSGIDEPATRGEIAWMLYFGLEANILKNIVFFNNEYLAEEKKGVNLLSENFNIYKAKGKVTGTRNTLLNEGNKNMADGFIMIDNKTYSVTTDAFDSYIGQEVTFYYKSDADTEKLILAFIDSKLRTFTVAADDIVEFDDKNIFRYLDENGKEKYAEVSLSADVIYNQKAIREYTNNDIMPPEGEVRLYDKDNDDVIDLMVISAARTYVISWVDVAGGIIYFKNSTTPLKLDFNKDDIEISDAYKNKEFAFDKLKEWNVLNVFESKNTVGRKSYKILVSTKSVNGTVSEISDQTLYIKNTKYDLSYASDLVELGTIGLFYLDAYGKIVATSGKESGKNRYGYLVAVGTGRGLAKPLVLKIFTQDGEMALLNCHKNALFDGKSVNALPGSASATAEEKLTAYLKGSGRLQDGTSIHQAIRFSTNFKGDVTAVNTMQAGSGENETDNLSNDVPSKTPTGNAYRRFFYSGVFDCDVAIDNESVIFVVPDDMSRTKDFGTMSAGQLVRGEPYVFEGYDVNESKIMGMIILPVTATIAVSNSSPIIMVDKIVKVLDGDEEKCKLIGLYKKKAVEFLEYEPGVFAAYNLKQGDVIQVGLAGSAVAQVRKLFYKEHPAAPAVLPLFAVSPQKPEYAKTTSVENMMTNDFYSGYGRVESKDGATAVIKYMENEYDPTMGPLRKSVAVKLDDAATDIYVYDEANKTVRLGTAADVVDVRSAGADGADRAFFLISSVLVKGIVIYK